MLLDLSLDLVDIYARLHPPQFKPNVLLTLAIVNMDNGIPVAQWIGHTADKPLGALWHSVDSDKSERGFGADNMAI